MYQRDTQNNNERSRSFSLSDASLGLTLREIDLAMQNDTNQGPLIELRRAASDANIKIHTITKYVAHGEVPLGPIETFEETKENHIAATSGKSVKISTDVIDTNEEEQKSGLSRTKRAVRRQDSFGSTLEEDSEQYEESAPDAFYPELSAFKNAIYTNAAQLDWSKYIQHDGNLSETDIERLKAISSYCFQLIQKEVGTTDARQQLNYAYGLLFAISTSINAGSWWLTSIALAVSVAICKGLSAYTAYIDTECKLFQNKYDELDRVLSKIATTGRSIGNDDFSNIFTESRFAKEFLDAVAISSITFLKLEKKLGVSIEKLNQLQTSGYWINMLRASALYIIEGRDYSKINERYTAAMSDAFLNSIEVESIVKLPLWCSRNLVQKITVPPHRHFLKNLTDAISDIESGASIIRIHNKNRTHSLVSFALNINRFKAMDANLSHIILQPETNEIFTKLSTIIKNETSIENQLFLRSSMLLVSCWLFSSALNQSTFGAYVTPSSLQVLISGVCVIVAQWMDSYGNSLREQKDSLRKARIGYKRDMIDACNRGWISHPKHPEIANDQAVEKEEQQPLEMQQPDMFHRIHKIAVSTWWQLKRDPEGPIVIEKCDPADVAMLSINISRAIYRLILDKRINEDFLDKNPDAFGYRFSSLISNQKQSDNTNSYLASVSNALGLPNVSFKKIPEEEGFYSLAKDIFAKLSSESRSSASSPLRNVNRTPSPALSF